MVVLAWCEWYVWLFQTSPEKQSQIQHVIYRPSIQFIRFPNNMPLSHSYYHVQFSCPRDALVGQQEAYLGEKAISDRCYEIWDSSNNVCAACIVRYHSPSIPSNHALVIFGDSFDRFWWLFQKFHERFPQVVHRECDTVWALPCPWFISNFGKPTLA